MVEPGKSVTHRRSLILLWTTACVTTLAPATVALAQRPLTPLGGEPPTAGIHLDTPSLVSSLDASGLETNPATLAMLDSWSLLLRHAEIIREGRVGGGGDALLFGLPLPFLSNIAVGGGLQWLRPTDAIGYEQSVKLSLGLALHVKKLFALGLGYHSFIADHDPGLDGLQTLDVGFAVHPFEFLGVGAVVHDLTTPVYNGLPLQRVYDVEVVGRPLRTDRLEVGAGLRIGERRANLDPHFRLAAIPVPGVRLFANVDLLNRDFYRDDDPLWDVRVTAGFGLFLEQIGIDFSAIVGRGLAERSVTPDQPLAADEARGGFQGGGITVRFQGARRQPLTVFKKKLLHVKLDGALPQRKWIKLVEALRRVERRSDLHGALLEIERFAGGWAQAQELRRWLKRLRKLGKKTYSHLRAPNAKEYYVAAAADKVFLDPGGDVGLAGLAVRYLYIRGLLDKAGASGQFFKIAEYKSAPETYTHKTASPAAREVRESLLDDLFQQVLRDLAADRGKTVAQMKALVDQGPFTPPLAERHGLVDASVTSGRLKHFIAELTKTDLTPLKGLLRAPDRWEVGPGIAVVLVDGDIVTGESTDLPLIGKMAGDKSFAEALRWARSHDEIKAVVLRVNSPGGSALASDRLWRETTRLHKVKPVVVSMGDMAASGGYFVACDADRIFAEEATFTGSIGIWTGKFDLSGLLAKLGIGIDASARGKRAGMEGFERPYTEDEQRHIRSRLQHYYRTFLGAVGKGRKMTQDQVHQVARGRVWTGRQAVRKGLVDSIGGLSEAIDEAKRRGALPADRPVRLFVLPKPKGGLLSRAAGLLRSGAPQKSALERLIPEPIKRTLQSIPPTLLRARSGEPLARVPYQIEAD